jgi:hypothetical protein
MGHGIYLDKPPSAAVRGGRGHCRRRSPRFPTWRRR